MTSDELYDLMEHPVLLSAVTLLELKQVVDDYPFFQTARMLYLKKLSLVNDIRFATELKKTAVCVSDRRKLFTLIEGDRYGILPDKEPESVVTLTDSFTLIDDYLSSRTEEDESKAEASLLFQPSASSDYIYWTLTKESDSTDGGGESATKLQHHDLIDNFIRNDEQRVPGSGFTQAADVEVSEVDETIVEQEERPDDAFFTETLARIYIKQKRYEKALQIIKNISLKYPEKNVYFADQIRFLEKLIINTKK